ncbi:hypothetical protein GCM10007216_33400 [Thalassobacillus devorans]|uniref:Uncharacterized protein n=1 Tax=Thalassobacillus devorans TaxID=279813 RepID=A0ABQ1PMW2_9BACI|nr:hypothetical protein [Thalassobacillus devorans]NIK30476.1 hypothetical protein [Thalassobacillus devorans]GGC99985.1 hypothetical protein GCM10007216_33400 [Thalassobacillus devorans]
MLKESDFPTEELRDQWIKVRNRKLEEMAQYIQRYFHLTKVRENEGSYEVQGYVYQPGYGEIRMAFEFTYEHVAKMTDLFDESIEK